MVSGAERSLLLHLDSLDRHEFQPLVVTSPNPLLQRELIARGVEYINLDFTLIRRPKSLWEAWHSVYRYVRNVVALTKLISLRHVSLIHSNSIKAHECTYVAAALRRVPTIVHVRDLRRIDPFEYPFFFGAKSVIAISQRVKHMLPSFLQTKTTVIHNGVDLEKFAPDRSLGSRFRDELGLTSNDKLIGIIG